jgi:hypothetical protein
MNIGISINEVLRDFLGQLLYTYDKYIEKTDIKETEITSLNLTEFLKFESTDECNRFLYLEAPLEIFGHADLKSDGVMAHFNNFLMDIKDEEEHQIILVGKEINKSIPSTFFFLSKTGCRAEKINFVQNAINEWDGVDLLITANPDALQNKPNGKISVKVKAPYNENVSADYEIDSILDFIKDQNLKDKIINSKITTYEEI